MEVCTFTDSVN